MIVRFIFIYFIFFSCSISFRLSGIYWFYVSVCIVRARLIHPIWSKTLSVCSLCNNAIKCDWERCKRNQFDRSISLRRTVLLVVCDMWILLWISTDWCTECCVSGLWIEKVKKIVPYRNWLHSLFNQLHEVETFWSQEVFRCWEDYFLQFELKSISKHARARSLASLFIKYQKPASTDCFNSFKSKSLHLNI